MDNPGSLDRLMLETASTVSPSFTSFLSSDIKLFNLPAVASTLGPKAAEAILLGLSRPIELTHIAASKLVDQWERFDEACLYTDPLNTLLARTDTLAIAISYRHVPQTQWFRKGPNRTAKMSDADINLFMDAVAGLKHVPFTPPPHAVVVWCDRILATRLGGDQNNLGWYNSGILPYAALRTLNLTTDTSRLWIKVEHSLSRLTVGFMSPFEAARGQIGSPGAAMPPIKALQTIASLILSGFWPKPDDCDYWANDFQMMKCWAMGIACRSRGVFDVPLFEVKPVDNLEILAAVPMLAAMSKTDSRDLLHPLPRLSPPANEPPFIMDDPFFFLRATIWNPFILDAWCTHDSTVSHFMGRLARDGRFSYWTCPVTRNIYGCLDDNMVLQPTSLLLAVPINNASQYKLFRQSIICSSYTHAEPVASPAMKDLFLRAGQNVNVTVVTESDWKLLYCYDEVCNPNTEREVSRVYQDVRPKADVVVPHIFVGMTTSIYRSALALATGEHRSTAIAAKIKCCTDTWNEYVRGNYDTWITVKDTSHGPLWMEGYDDTHVSFSYLEYLTNALIVDQETRPINRILLREKSDILLEIHRLYDTLSFDCKVCIDELFGECGLTDCEQQITQKEVAHFMVAGGFSSGMDLSRISNFLMAVAERKGYWSTIILCREGELQIRFYNEDGEERIASRPIDARDFTARGLVHPEDANAVYQVSCPLDPASSPTNAINWFQEDMAFTTSREEIVNLFKNSCRPDGDKGDVLMVDMTRIENGVEQQPNFVAVEAVSGTARSSHPRVVDRIDRSTDAAINAFSQGAREGMMGLSADQVADALGEARELLQNSGIDTSVLDGIVGRDQSE